MEPAADLLLDSFRKQLGTYTWEMRSGGWNGNRVLITKTNLVQLVYAFWLNHIRPLDVPFVRLLFWMIDSGIYLPSSTWLIQGGSRGMDMTCALAFWRIVQFPDALRQVDIERVFFAPEKSSSGAHSPPSCRAPSTP